jgi:hypothetical protein
MRLLTNYLKRAAFVDLQMVVLGHHVADGGTAGRGMEYLVRRTYLSTEQSVHLSNHQS